MSQESLRLIEKQRYLIPCKCRICNKGFEDIMICQKHIYKEHEKREKTNIIDNIIWNVEDDIKKYEILKKLEDERNLILKKLTDDKELEEIEIPLTIKIKNKEYELKSFIDSLDDKDKKPEEKIIKDYSKELEKQISNYINAIKRVSMGKEVQAVLKDKKTTIQSLMNDIDNYTVLRKAIQLIDKYL